MAKETSMLFNFWGAMTEVSVKTSYDLAHLRYYFSDYVSNTSVSPHVKVSLEAMEPGVPYMMAGVDQRRVEVETTESLRPDVIDGKRTILADTPIPPFRYPPLCDEVETVHAASVAHPVRNGEALVIEGQTCVGKSSIMCALIDRGWLFLSDDTTVLNPDGIIYPFTRPVGLRQRSLSRLGFNVQQTTNGRLYQTFTGPTLSVHPREMDWVISDAARPRWVVRLFRSSQFRVAPVSGRVLSIGLAVDRHCDSALRVIEEFCGS